MRRSTRFLALAASLFLATSALAAVLPNAPTNLTAIKSPSSPKTTIDVSWIDQSDNETGFRIERCPGSGCTDFMLVAQVGANATSHHDFDLPGGVTLRYRVQAVNDFGASAFSNEAEATTDPFDLPAAPSGLTATALSSTRVRLTWQDNATNENGFFVDRCAGAGCENFGTVALAGPNATSVDDTTTNANTTYRYRVSAHNDDGVSGQSNIAEATTSDGPPIAPSDLRGTAIRQGKKATINLSWADQSNDETAFQLERCVGASCANFSLIATLAANSMIHQDTSVARRTTYRYRVRAVRGASTSGYSNVLTIATP